MEWKKNQSREKERKKREGLATTCMRETRVECMEWETVVVVVVVVLFCLWMHMLNKCFCFISFHCRLNQQLSNRLYALIHWPNQIILRTFCTIYVNTNNRIKIISIVVIIIVIASPSPSSSSSTVVVGAVVATNSTTTNTINTTTPYNCISHDNV